VSNQLKRILMAKTGLDGHWRGPTLVARALRLLAQSRQLRWRPRASNPPFKGPRRMTSSPVASIELVNEIRTALGFSRPVGNDRFRQQIEGTFGRKIGQTRRARPLTRLVPECE
jgi:hypothetical protein